MAITAVETWRDSRIRTGAVSSTGMKGTKGGVISQARDGVQSKQRTEALCTQAAAENTPERKLAHKPHMLNNSRNNSR